MSKKYKHHNPHTTDPLLQIENDALRTKLRDLEKDHERLQTALRMLTSTDKQTLLDAVNYVERGRTVDWYTQPIISPTPITYTTPTIYTTTGTSVSNITFDVEAKV